MSAYRCSKERPQVDKLLLVKYMPSTRYPFQGTERNIQKNIVPEKLSSLLEVYVTEILVT